MRCSKARDYLSRDLDGLLPPDATAGLRAHVDACAECQAFREDLVLGRRLLAATEPRLPDNFDWKLQLRLNQALQQRAGETAYPWLEEPAPRRTAWLPAFGAATSVGLAAMLAVAVFLGPREAALTGARGPATAPALEQPVLTATAPATALTPSAADAASLAGRSDRRSLFGAPRSTGLYGAGIQRSVSTGSRVAGAPATIGRGWSGDRLEDLQTISQLRERNEQLERRLFQYQLEMRTLKAQLDTTGGRGLDTGSR
jgi:hypothetical protein